MPRQTRYLLQTLARKGAGWQTVEKLRDERAAIFAGDVLARSTEAWEIRIKQGAAEVEHWVLREERSGPMNKPTLTPDQHAAILAFAAKHGRTWKDALRDAWMTGAYDDHNISGYLQQVRNTLGPRWLINFRLPTEPR